jgi:quinol monooxygenase YgiN
VFKDNLMNKHLYIVARIEAFPDQVEHLKTELKRLITLTLDESGCIQYDLHQDNDNPMVFLFYEIWENRELWRDHMNSTHVAEFGKATAGRVAALSINEMSRI